MSSSALDQRITEAEVLGWLAESHVFDALSDSDLRQFLPSLRILNFKAGDQAIVQGKYSSALYIVTAGRFDVMRPDGVAVAHLDASDLNALYEFQPGDCFGEYSLIDNEPASASVVAAVPSQAVQIPRRDFNSVLMSDYRIAKTVYQNLLLLLTARLRRSLKV